MFELSVRRRTGIPILGLLITALVLGCPDRISGQTAADYRARIERLLPEWRAALAADSLARQRQPVEADTVYAGRLALLALPADRDFVVAIAGAVEKRLTPVLGSDALLLRGHPILTYSEKLRDTVVLVSGDHGYVQFPETADAETVADQVRAQLERQLAQRLHQRTRTWLGGNVPLRRPSTAMIERIYVDLATSDSRSARLCIEDRLASCLDALALADYERPLTVWYGPVQRQRLVERLRFGRNQKELSSQCIDEGRDSACVELLSGISVGAYWPLSTGAHRLLAWLAFERGGPKAYGRFLDQGDMAIQERLAAAAGVEVESLVAVWREQVMAGRPQKAITTFWVGLAALGWTLGLALVASRSSRWRLG